jgi:hypothetical protein
MVYTDVTMLLSEKLCRVVVLKDVTLYRLGDRYQFFFERPASIIFRVEDYLVLKTVW